MSLEETLSAWACAPSTTESQKCDNAVSVICKAVNSYRPLQRRTINVFAQGSYCNRTNVRQDSDVDVCLRCRDTMFFKLPQGIEARSLGIQTPADYQYHSYKNDIEAALKSYFKGGHVMRGNKAIDIRENTYRIAADAVACFEYREYFTNGSHREGISFMTDNGSQIVNWPQQNYDNGVSKNNATNRRFKDVVRTLKTLRYKMSDEKIPEAMCVPSFFIESLVWNVSNQYFDNSWPYLLNVKSCIGSIYEHTVLEEKCAGWFEVNGIKPLFSAEQAWKFADAKNFAQAAWSYLKLGDI